MQSGIGIWGFLHIKKHSWILPGPFKASGPAVLYQFNGSEAIKTSWWKCILPLPCTTEHGCKGLVLREVWIPTLKPFEKEQQWGFKSEVGLVWCHHLPSIAWQPCGWNPHLSQVPVAKLQPTSPNYPYGKFCFYDGFSLDKCRFSPGDEVGCMESHLGVTSASAWVLLQHLFTVTEKKKNIVWVFSLSKKFPVK